MSDQMVLDNLQRYFEAWQEALGARDLGGVLRSLMLMKGEVDKLAGSYASVKSTFAAASFDTISLIAELGKAEAMQQRFNQVYGWILEYADKALRDDPMDLRGQFLRAQLASMDLDASPSGFGDVIKGSRQAGNSFMRGFRFGEGVVSVIATKKRYREELFKLVRAYRYTFNKYYKPFYDFIEFSNILLAFEEFSERQNVGDRQEILEAILSVELGDLIYPDGVTQDELNKMKIDVNEIVQLARVKLANL